MPRANTERRITESQNHSMLGVGRDLCGSSSPIPLPKQGHLQQAAQDLVQVGLEYLQRRRLHNLPGQPVPVLPHPQREEVLPHVQMELPVLQFVPVAPCPVAGHHWKEPGPTRISLEPGRGRQWPVKSSTGNCFCAGGVDTAWANRSPELTQPSWPWNLVPKKITTVCGNLFH